MVSIGILFLSLKFLPKKSEDLFGGLCHRCHDVNMPLSLNKYFEFYIFSQTHICRLVYTPSNPQFGKQLQGLSGGVSHKIRI